MNKEKSDSKYKNYKLNVKENNKSQFIDCLKLNHPLLGNRIGEAAIRADQLVINLLFRKFDLFYAFTILYSPINTCAGHISIIQHKLTNCFHHT
jgi:hypothetical protein